MSVTGQEYYYYELKLRLVHLLLRYSINLIFFTNNLSVLTRFFLFLNIATITSAYLVRAFPHVRERAA